MIRKFRALLLFSITSILVVYCGSPTGTSGGSKFEGVPSGEIVPVEKRDSVLTGVAPTDSNHTKAKGMTQKWWLHGVSEISYKGCEGYQDSTITHENTYVAFTPDGEYYQKVGETGSKQHVTSWEWSDESKSAIILENYPEIDFEIRSLNEEEVIYASLQPQGDGCEVVTWEQFGEPVVEEVKADSVEEGGTDSMVLGNTLEHDPYRSIFYTDTEFGNTPKFPSNEVLLQSVQIDSTEPAQYTLTIGDSIEGESELKITFDELVEGRTYYVGGNASYSKYHAVRVDYDNTVRPFGDGYTLSYMQEVLENPSLEFYNIENKGTIDVFQLDKANRNITLTLNGVHLVYLALCSEDCSVTSPTFDGGWQYETHFVNLYGTIQVVYDDRLL